MPAAPALAERPLKLQTWGFLSRKMHMMSEREAEFVARKRFDEEVKLRAMRIYREKDAAYADAERKDKEAREALITEFDLQIQDVRPMIAELQHIEVHQYLTATLPIHDYADKWRLSQEYWLETWRSESPKIIHALRRIWAAIPTNEKLDGHITRAIELMRRLQRPAVLPPIDAAKWRNAEERARQELEGEFRVNADLLMKRDARAVHRIEAATPPTPQTECAISPKSTPPSLSEDLIALRAFVKTKGIRGDAATRAIDRLEKRLHAAGLKPMKSGQKAVAGKSAVPSLWNHADLEKQWSESRETEQGKQGK